MNKQMIKKMFLNSVIGAATLVTAAQAGDTDVKVYSAAHCHAAYPADVQRLVFGTGGKVSNISNVSAYVVCPIVRDRSESTWESITFRFHDRHPSQNIRCAFRVFDENTGATLQQRTVASRGTGRSEGWTFNYSECGLYTGCDDDGAKNNAFYVARCVIPPRSSNGLTSSIDGYEFTEGEPGLRL